jgi:uncharacterized membrane protein YhaH (DUF805 family)
MKITRHSYWFFLLASIAAVFTAMLACSAGLYSRPDFDEDHQRRVLSLMIPSAFIFALVLGSPLSLLVYFCLRCKRLAVALPVIFILPAVCGFMLTPLVSDMGIWGAVLALIFSVLGCAMLPNKSPEPTAVGAGSSADAVHVAGRRWLSFFR